MGGKEDESADLGAVVSGRSSHGYVALYLPGEPYTARRVGPVVL